MNIFKISYKTVRENSDVIFKGFGFRHLSDATQYYVHPDNQSYRGTTTLCQPIGEAVILFTSLLTSIMAGKGFGDYYFNDNRSSACLESVRRISRKWGGEPSICIVFMKKIP